MKIDIDKFILKEEPHEKKAFYASDFGKPELDLYYAFKNEPKTNPVTWFASLKMAAGKGVEEQLLKVLKQSGIVAEDYDQKEHGRIEYKINDIQINGYIDAKTIDGEPIEIKSINNKNSWDISKYENNEPRENYVGQLGFYMLATEKNHGTLLVSSIDGLSFFTFDAYLKDGIVTCGKTVVNLYKEIERWSNIYKNYILTNMQPDIWEYRYKYDINTLDWTTISSADISKARNGHKILGDFQILYSPWKDKIVKLQGETLGYTLKELEIIKEKTAGYSSKLKKYGK